MFALLFPFYVGALYIPARVVLTVYLIFDNILPFLIQSSVAGVAHGAHIGGFIAGAAAAGMMRPREPRERRGQRRANRQDGAAAGRQ
jgi:membrane associated rhomboid family serine protease